ncbi:hypothetical protein ATANTOWER_032026 [Ataeniobius toweri]|uniref:Secreted protein n=1 Tax=Ataeniobius toweri TaxID=208326 RepID=A0ABU7AU53_9TELE|nr:hypothetical protein [Ataeniobius toweri]
MFVGPLYRSHIVRWCLLVFFLQQPSLTAWDVLSVTWYGPVNLGSNHFRLMTFNHTHSTWGVVGSSVDLSAPRTLCQNCSSWSRKTPSGFQLVWSVSCG